MEIWYRSGFIDFDDVSVVLDSNNRFKRLERSSGTSLRPGLPSIDNNWWLTRTKGNEKVGEPIGSVISINSIYVSLS